MMENFPIHGHRFAVQRRVLLLEDLRTRFNQVVVVVAEASETGPISLVSRLLVIIFTVTPRLAALMSAFLNSAGGKK